LFVPQGGKDMPENTVGTEAKKNREIFDREIGPLMRQVHAVCKKHQIPMAAGFAMGETEPGKNMCAAIKVLPDGVEIPEHMLLAFVLLESPGKMLEALGHSIEPENVKNAEVILAHAGGSVH
jgi:hypothetical protein